MFYIEVPRFMGFFVWNFTRLWRIRENTHRTRIQLSKDPIYKQSRGSFSVWNDILILSFVMTNAVEICAF